MCVVCVCWHLFLVRAAQPLIRLKKTPTRTQAQAHAHNARRTVVQTLAGEQAQCGMRVVALCQRQGCGCKTNEGSDVQGPVPLPRRTSCTDWDMVALCLCPCLLVGEACVIQFKRIRRAVG